MGQLLLKLSLVVGWYPFLRHSVALTTFVSDIAVFVLNGTLNSMQPTNRTDNLDRMRSVIQSL